MDSNGMPILPTPAPASTPVDWYYSADLGGVEEVHAFASNSGSNPVVSDALHHCNENGKESHAAAAAVAARIVAHGGGFSPDHLHRARQQTEAWMGGAGGGAGAGAEATTPPQSKPVCLV